MTYEYHVIPAPTKGQKEKGAKTADQRYAAALAAELNAQAADGWDFLRSEVMPTQERSGLSGSKTVFVTMLIFRRAVNDLADEATEDAIRMIGHGA